MSFLLDTNAVIGLPKNAERIRERPFEPEDARIAGGLRADLARAGTPIGPYDILIAAQAIRTHSVLVTGNTREFERVSGLSLENWSRGG